MANQVRVAVTGAAGQIGYALLFRIASGQMFGPNTEVHLNLLELEAALPALNGVKMELDDCAFPTLKSVTCTSDLKVAFKDCDWALLVGSVPRKDGMERSDLLKINGGIFTKQGQAIAEVAKPDCKVLVVGNPCNTNALICMNAALKINKAQSPRNFFAMTMLDQNRALTQIAQKAGTDVKNVKNLVIWGNHSPTMYPDFFTGEVVVGSDRKKIPTVITDDAWLKGAFLETVQKRGAAIIKARGLSSAASAANAVVDTVKALTTPTPSGEAFSVAVCSDGNPYGIASGLIYSFPIRSNGSQWEIAKGYELNAFSKEKLKVTEKELLDEKSAVAELLA